MADTLQDLLGLGHQNQSANLDYVAFLVGQSIEFLQFAEPQKLSHSSHSLLLSTEGLSKKSHRLTVESAAKHATLRKTLDDLASRVSKLKQSVPALDSGVHNFLTKFSKAGENETLPRRIQVLRLLESSDRFVNFMQVPALLASAIHVAPVGYASTLDLYAYIRRLVNLYPDSKFIMSVMEEAETTIHRLAAELINQLKAPNLKLASAIRTFSWFKRIIPNFTFGMVPEDTLPTMFLVCRLVWFFETLYALEPLRRLADEERNCQIKASATQSGGQQAERYLKRFIEVFREHSFNIVSIAKGVSASLKSVTGNGLHPLPSAFATFPLHFTDILFETLRSYLPLIRDQAFRDSILTQLLYCAGSLGRLGVDFGLLLASIGVHEWAEFVKRHQFLAGRLDSVMGEYHAT